VNRFSGRRFEPVVLGIDGPEPHPDLAALLLLVRAEKRVRALARSAAAQHRHLCDMTAFESYLSRAALASIEEQIDPTTWLEQQLCDIRQEQSETREEHARMMMRIAALANSGTGPATKAGVRGRALARAGDTDCEARN
jgi:hypothetical protein